MRGAWIVAIVACRVPALDLVGKQCPCPSGYTCDVATDKCTLGDAAPAGDGARDAAGTVDTLRDARATYREIVLSDQPVGYWRLGDSGTTARDETGAHDGTYSGACAYGVPGAIAGDADTAVTFDGSTCKITLPVAYPFANNAPYSVEAWSSTTSNALYQMIFCDEVRNSTNPIDGYALLVTPTNFSGGFELEREVSMNGIKTPIQPVASGFHHVVATYDGTQLALYVDGAFIGQTTDMRTAATITQAALIGASSQGNAYQGTLDEIALYPTALSAPRIAAHYAAGTQP
ncbi:MAG TPA: LamG domain-containing protein [Kofleriaceae bacterium]|nr:LamG domain-containing protein [Kofleriaceae bacterium]